MLSHPKLLQNLPVNQFDSSSRDPIEHGVTKAVNAIPGNLCEISGLGLSPLSFLEIVLSILSPCEIPLF
jgi:hypothetical protein